MVNTHSTSKLELNVNFIIIPIIPFRWQLSQVSNLEIQKQKTFVNYFTVVS